MSKKAKKSSKPSAVQVEGQENLLSINDVAREFELSPIYVRNAIRHQLIETTMVPIAPESKTLKHLMTREAVVAWRETRNSRSRREDGRNKFTLYATPEEKAQIEALLANNEIGALIEKAYVKKVDDEASDDELVTEAA